MSLPSTPAPSARCPRPQISPISPTGGRPKAREAVVPATSLAAQPANPLDQTGDLIDGGLTRLGLILQLGGDDIHQRRPSIVVALVEPGVELHKNERSLNPLRANG
jgi:hypothetical protein